VVLLVDILTSEVNSGYSDERLEVVHEVNGRKVGSLRDVAESVEASSGRYVSFGLSSGYRVTINREEARANAHEVLQRYGVALDRSERLQAALAAQRLPGSGLTAGNAAVSSVNEPAKTELIR
jgi:hypothetical protein